MEQIGQYLFPRPQQITLHQPKQPSQVSLSIVDIPTTIDAKISHCSQVTYQQDATLAKQSYQLTISLNQIHIAYCDSQALLYAHYVLRQLLHNGQVLHCLKIKDQPDFLKRGILLDISRDKIPTMTRLFELINLWSELRINQLQLYTEHTFAYQNHQTVWQGYDPLTAQEIRVIDHYCQTKGIELIPNQATFGHMEKWLCHSDYQHMAEQTDGFYDQRGDFRPQSFGLNPCHSQVPQFIESLLDELLPNFQSNTLNINFDETMDLGVDGSKQACDEKGKGQVYLDYLKTILSIAESKGKRCQIFSDMLFHYPEILPYLPKNLELLNWGYEEDHPYDIEHQKLSEFGYPFQVVVSTNCFASVIGRRQAAEVHMRRAAISAKKYGAQGYMISEWGDMGHAQPFCAPLPYYIFGAAMAWGESQRAEINIHKGLCYFYPQEDPALLQHLLTLQNHYLSSGVTTPNCAFYGPFIFDQISKRHIKRAEVQDESTLKSAINQLQMDKKQLRKYQTTPLQQQLNWVVDTMILASHIALYYQQQNTRELNELSHTSKAHLLSLLTLVKNPYFDIWQHDYRLGGCQQSFSRLLILEEQLK
ncbi:MAG: family 20 glycosylhydrolase [Vibrio hibernica]